MSIFDNLTESQEFNLLNPTSSANNSSLLQQNPFDFFSQVDAIREQNALDTIAQQQRIQEEKTKQRRNPREGFNKFLTAVESLGLGLKGKDPETYRATQEKLLRDAENERLKEEYISSLPQETQMMYRVYGPEAAFKAQYPENTRNYKPDLVNYKNTGTEVITIGNMALSPGQTMPFNVSIPEIANAISGTPNLEEDRNQVVYTRQGALYTTPDGDYREIIQGGQRIFDGPKGQFDAGQFFAQYPETRSKTSGEEQRYIPDFKTFTGLSKELTEAERSMKKLENYFNNVANANVGFQRLGDEISQWAKTLAGSVNLTIPELARAIAEGQLQGLVGANRIDTVGGGVMTEKDAWRVVTRLGGDVTALQSPQVVAEQLKLIYSDKARQYNNDIKGYNLGVASKKYAGYDKRERIDQEKIDDLFNLLPPGIPKGSQKINKDGVTLYQDGDTFYAIQNDEAVIVDIDG